MKIGTKPPETMTAGQINAELDKLDKARSALGEEMISAGRGYEKPSETVKLSDPLALRLRALWDRRSALDIEISMRYGPDAPHRLPTGGRHHFGPRKRLP